MTNIVNPAVKFSYNIIKGSISERRRMIADYNKKIFNEICEHIEDQKFIKVIYKNILKKYYLKRRELKLFLLKK